MTVKELIKEYELGKKKSNYTLEKHVVLKYMPHAQKISLAKGVVNNSSFAEVNGKKVYKRDTPTKFFLFTMKVIKEYTDIEIDSDKIVEQYDALYSSGVMEDLLACIPNKEMTILQGLLDMAQDDLEMNTRSLVSFLETKSETMKLALDSIAKVLEKPEIKAKLAELSK